MYTMQTFLSENYATTKNHIRKYIHWHMKLFPGYIKQKKGGGGYDPNLLSLQNACVAAAAKSLQSCPTLRDPIDGSPPGSPVPGILQARTLEWLVVNSCLAL